MDLKQLLTELTQLNYIHPDDIPNIELYMDQLTTFMNDKLEGCKRTPEDKILTKTMINNYSKNHLIPPSTKKKYSKEHLILLIYVYYLKNFLSITDIKLILSPLIEMFYDKKDPSVDFLEIYQHFYQDGNDYYDTFRKNIYHIFKKSRSSFPEVESEKEREFLQNLSLISTLSFDIYMKKKLIEGMIDSLYTPAANKPSKKDSTKKT